MPELPPGSCALQPAAAAGGESCDHGEGPAHTPAPDQGTPRGDLHDILHAHREQLLRHLNDWACTEHKMIQDFMAAHCRHACGAGSALEPRESVRSLQTDDLGTESRSQAAERLRRSSVALGSETPPILRSSELGSCSRDIQEPPAGRRYACGEDSVPEPGKSVRSRRTDDSGTETQSQAAVQLRTSSAGLGSEAQILSSLSDRGSSSRDMPGFRRNSIGATSLDPYAADSYDSQDMWWEQMAYAESGRRSGHDGIPSSRRRVLGIDTTSTYFEVFFASLIISNSILIGVELECGTGNPSGDTPILFLVLNQIFTSLFVAELALRAATDRCELFRSRQWAWNVFDIIVVVSAIMESVLEYLHYTERLGLGNLRIVRFVRLVRILRVLRIPRIMRYVDALYHLVCSLACTMKSLGWAFVLLIIIMYIFGIVFTQAVFDHLSVPGNVDSDGAMKEYWGSLFKSMSTLFFCITDGLSWRIAVQPLAEIHGIWVLFFTIFYAFTIFAVLNIVTAAFVQSATTGAARDIDMIAMSMRAKEEAHDQAVQALFSVLDPFGTGYITLDQLNRNIDNDCVKAYLALLELHTSNAWKLFKLLDINGDHKISYDEFLEGSLRLSGASKSIDVAILQYEQRWLRKRLCVADIVTV